MTEHYQQAQLIAWAAAHESDLPELALLFAIPNGGVRYKRTAGMLKAEGLRAGVPDLFLPVPRGKHHGLWLEMKSGPGRVTAEQRTWLDRLGAQGYDWAICWSWEAARDTILAYLGQ